MGDVLSQNEIDALLSALSSGSVDAEELKEEQEKKKIRVYDFKRPNKFSKDQFHTLQVIYENYARSLGTFLSAQMRSMVQIDVLNVEQLTYEEFTRSIPNPTILSIFSFYPLHGSSIMEINPVLGFAFLDRLLGGPGNSLDKLRPLTEIEESVIEKLCQRMLGYMQEPWGSIIQVEPAVERIETNPQFTQLVSASEIMIIASLEAQMGELVGMINICMPFYVLEPIVDKLSVHYYYAFAHLKQSQENKEMLRQRLAQAPVTIKAILGESVITVQELLELGAGDVLVLDRKTNDDLKVVVGDSLKYFGKPGMLEDKMAIKIHEIIEEVNEDE